MPNLSILDHDIRESSGLYCLNDLHQASGGALNQDPIDFLKINQTTELVGEIQKSGIAAYKIQKGKNGGSYACKQLLLAYAAWISPRVQLAVINALLDVQQDSSQSHFSSIFNGLRQGRYIITTSGEGSAIINSMDGYTYLPEEEVERMRSNYSSLQQKLEVLSRKFNKVSLID